MLKIRLQRTGRKHENTFRIVLTDSKNSTKSGRYKETLGSYDPRKENSAQIQTDRIKYWLSVGAKATGTVHNLLLSNKVIEGKRVNVLPRKSPPKKEENENKQPTSTQGEATPPQANSSGASLSENN